MAALQKEDLTPEEKASGFQPGGPDDESFRLESQDDYPGELPDFKAIEEEAEPDDVQNQEDADTKDTVNSADGIPDDSLADSAGEEIDEFGATKAPKIETPESGSVWDLFEDAEQQSEPQTSGLDEGIEGLGETNTEIEGDDDLTALAADIAGGEDDDLAALAADITGGEEVQEEAVADEEIEEFPEEITEDDDLAALAADITGGEDDDLAALAADITGGEEVQEEAVADEEIEEFPEEITEDDDLAALAADITGGEDDDLAALAADITGGEEEQAESVEEEAEELPEDTAIEEAIEDQDLTALAEDIEGGGEEQEEALQNIEEGSIEEDIQEEVAEEQEEPETSEGEWDAAGLEIDEPVEVDNDLRNLIQGELDRSEERKEKRKDKPLAKESKKLSEEEMEQKLKNFQAVEEGEDTETIDLSEIEAVHPSTANIKEVKTKKKAPAKKPKKEQEPENETVEELIDDSLKAKKDKKKKKKAGILPWGKITTVAASIVLISLLSYGSYHIVTNSGWLDSFAAEEDSVAEESHDEHAEITQHEEESHEAEEVSHEVEEPVDSHLVAAEEHHADSSLGEEAIQPEESDSNLIAKADIEEQHVPEEVTHETTTEPETKKVHKKRTVKTAKKSYTPKNSAKNETTRYANTKYSRSKSDKGVYTVEVYSSPSRDDAEEWLKRLKKKNIKNAFIVTHKRRDEKWFKVRIGNFETKEEAKDKAKKLGYSQSWVDRVK